MLSAIHGLTFPLCGESSLVRLASFGREAESAFDEHSLLDALKPNLSAQFDAHSRVWKYVRLADLPFLVRHFKRGWKRNLRRFPNGNIHVRFCVILNRNRKRRPIPRSAIAADRGRDDLFRFLIRKRIEIKNSAQCDNEQEYEQNKPSARFHHSNDAARTGMVP